jgi:hypothetical protein
MQLKLLSPNQYSSVTSLFDQGEPNYPVAMSVIEKNYPGSVWVDNESNLTVCMVIAGGGYSFVKGTASRVATYFPFIVDQLKANNAKVVCRLNDPLMIHLAQAGFSVRERLHFQHGGDMSIVDNVCSTLQPDCQVKFIDGDLIARSSWIGFIRLCWGNESAFLEHNFGLALMRGDEILSEAFACCVGGGFVETGSVTAEPYRRQGFATLIRAFLLRELHLRKLTPISSCNADNLGSAKASAKLGFIQDMRYQFWCP